MPNVNYSLVEKNDRKTGRGSRSEITIDPPKFTSSQKLTESFVYSRFDVPAFPSRTPRSKSQNGDHKGNREDQKPAVTRYSRINATGCSRSSVI